KVLNKLAKYALETISSIEFPDLISSESLQTVCDDSKRAFALVGRERAKWFPRVAPYFIVDRRRFDIAFGKASKSLEKLCSFSAHEYTKARTVEESFSMVDRLSQSLKKLDEVEAQKKEVKSRRGILEKTVDENQQKIVQIQRRSDMAELAQTNKKIEELEDELKLSLRRLQKPFLKFQTLVLGPGYPLPSDEAKKLDEYLDKPFEAFTTEDDGYPVLKTLLHSMNVAMTKGKLKLKSTRLKKALTQIDSILRKDTLLSLQKSCKDAFHDKQRLSTSNAMTTSRKESAQLRKEQRDLQKKMKLIDSRFTAVNGEHKGILRKIQNQKKELEGAVLEITGDDVHITL
ncbi:MAG: hypothetical protein JSV85_03790, partial [Candidatus Bathyarchaeota archaeon]